MLFLDIFNKEHICVMFNASMKSCVSAKSKIPWWESAVLGVVRGQPHPVVQLPFSVRPANNWSVNHETKQNLGKLSEVNMFSNTKEAGINISIR